MTMAGHVQDAAAPGRLRDGVREVQAEDRQGLVDVLARTDRDGGHGDGVFEHQAPAADPGHALAHGGVGVGVAGTGGRDQAGHLRVGHGGEQGGEAGDGEGDPDGRAGERHRLAQDDQDAGAQGGADADHGQLQDTEAADQPRAAVAGFGLADQLSDRLAAQELGGEPGTGGFRRRAFADQSWHSHR